LVEYSNPEIKENTNVSERKPLRELFLLLGAMLILALMAILSLSLLAEKLAVYVPFEVEQSLAQQFTDDENTSTEIQSYLQGLVDDLSHQMDLPDGMQVTVHYSEDDILNAFATLGGHIFIYQGLLDALDSENTLAMVIAHEIAHVKHRHPIIAAGRGMVIAMLIVSLTGLDNNTLIGNIVSSTGMLAITGFSREQERQSDQSAIEALLKHYGHVNGASDLFEILIREGEEQLLSLEFLSTHPVSQDRIDSIAQRAFDQGWPTTGQLIPLPVIAKRD
jgi:predicted Zn-dependent protease